jgi:hypothetical protein
VARGSERRQKRKIYPLQLERGGESVITLVMGCDKFYLHQSALGHVPTGLETPQPSSGGVGIIFTT